jgi:hypothetical protein
MKQSMSPFPEQCFRNTSMDVDVYSLIDNTFVRGGDIYPVGFTANEHEEKRCTSFDQWQSSGIRE